MSKYLIVSFFIFFGSTVFAEDSATVSAYPFCTVGDPDCRIINQPLCKPEFSGRLIVTCYVRQKISRIKAVDFLKSRGGQTIGYQRTSDGKDRPVISFWGTESCIIDSERIVCPSY